MRLRVSSEVVNLLLRAILKDSRWLSLEKPARLIIPGTQGNERRPARTHSKESELTSCQTQKRFHPSDVKDLATKADGRGSIFSYDKKFNENVIDFDVP